MCYPRYTRRQMPRLTGRELVVEHVDTDQVRFYFPDCKGHLRLILINHGTLDAVSEDILSAEFGVSYLELSLGWATSSMNAHLTLDHWCFWPKALFPDRHSVKMPMPDIPSVSAHDAWI